MSNDPRTRVAMEEEAGDGGGGKRPKRRVRKNRLLAVCIAACQKPSPRPKLSVHARVVAFVKGRTGITPINYLGTTFLRPVSKNIPTVADVGERFLSATSPRNSFHLLSTSNSSFHTPRANLAIERVMSDTHHLNEGLLVRPDRRLEPVSWTSQPEKLQLSDA
ncbi:hypothetical protein BHM03_00006224 [Ensete ventricosum]|uniref:Uncharacterized protein n=1 Tax=Ensete ventricosum TaxID=4639 RepID=A0A445MBT7_ENSVE|nr:hypothetical protein BHM03_00006224 [Ensete ventricosum]